MNQDFLPQVSEMLKAKISMSTSPDPKVTKTTTTTPSREKQNRNSTTTEQHGYSTVELHELAKNSAVAPKHNPTEPKEEEDDWEILKPLGNVFRRMLKDPDTEQSVEPNLDYFGSKRRRIDVYCFADDGGLVLLLPHLLSKANEPPWVSVIQCYWEANAVNIGEE